MIKRGKKMVDKKENWWGRLSYTWKGGIIGLPITLCLEIIFLIFYLTGIGQGDNGSVVILSVLPFGILLFALLKIFINFGVALNSFGFIFFSLFNFVILFIGGGALIGFIFGKIKNRKSHK